MRLFRQLVLLFLIVVLLAGCIGGGVGTKSSRSGIPDNFPDFIPLTKDAKVVKYTEVDDGRDFVMIYQSKASYDDVYALYEDFLETYPLNYPDIEVDEKPVSIEAIFFGSTDEENFSITVSDYDFEDHTEVHIMYFINED